MFVTATEAKPGHHPCWSFGWLNPVRVTTGVVIVSSSQWPCPVQKAAFHRTSPHPVSSILPGSASLMVSKPWWKVNKDFPFSDGHPVSPQHIDWYPLQEEPSLTEVYKAQVYTYLEGNLTAWAFRKTTMASSTLGSIISPATGFWPGLQCHSSIHFCIIDLKSKQTSVSYRLSVMQPWQVGIVASRAQGWGSPWMYFLSCCLSYIVPLSAMNICQPKGSFPVDLRLVSHVWQLECVERVSLCSCLHFNSAGSGSMRSVLQTIK